jgi:uncharacterized protein HemX
MKSTQEQNLNVIPFRGEMYQPVAPPVVATAKSNSSFLLLACLCLVGMGVALGASVTYNSTDQEQIRQMQQQLQQFEKVKKQLCIGG